MFLSQRTAQIEHFDLPTRSASEVALAFRELARINRIFCFAEVFQRLIPRALGPERCRSLKLLDLGAGDGSLGRALTLWSASRGWTWKITSLDRNPLALQLNCGGRNVAGSATALPFHDQSFDVVIANQMTHHLGTEEQVCRHFQEACRVSRELLLLNDLHRNLGLYFVLGCVLHLFNSSRDFREDGLLSIQRGWRVREWRRIAERAEIPGAKVFLYFGARICLMARNKSLKRPRSLHVRKPFAHALAQPQRPVSL